MYEGSAWRFPSFGPVNDIGNEADVCEWVFKAWTDDFAILQIAGCS